MMETSEGSVEFPSLELPSKEEFSAVVNSDFVARLADDREVKFHFFKLHPGISNKFQESFSLLFRTPLDVPPVQGMYDFEHSALGKLSLFLVPVGQKEDHFVYESVFNNLKVTE